MNTHEFFAQSPVFTHDEFKKYLTAQGTTNPLTQQAILAYHLKKDHIVRIRRGFFASVPPFSQVSASTFPVDPYLIAGRITHDAVLAYHTALDFHGVSYSTYQQFTFLSQVKIRPFTFQQANYHYLPFPQNLLNNNNSDFDVHIVNREGLDIKVTGLERTMVDALDRPDYAGGWEEIWRSVAHIPILNIDKMIEYAFLLANSTTIAKLGFFLEQHQQQFVIDEQQFNLLQEKKPHSAHYLERVKREPGKLVKRWNLIVPTAILKQNWEEPDNDIF